jgi:hypothetical protein
MKTDRFRFEYSKTKLSTGLIPYQNPKEEYVCLPPRFW